MTDIHEVVNGLAVHVRGKLLLPLPNRWQALVNHDADKES